MLQCGIAFRKAVFIQFVIPGGFIVLACFRIITGEQPVFKIVIFTDDQAGVGVRLNIFTVDFFIFHQVLNDT